MTYCLDTSAILDGWARYYPPDIFPSFWERLDGLLRARGAQTCRQVLEELKGKDDGAADWLKGMRMSSVRLMPHDFR